MDKKFGLSKLAVGCLLLFASISPTDAYSQIIISKELQWEEPTVTFENNVTKKRLNLLEFCGYDSSFTVPTVCIEAELPDWDSEDVSINIHNTKWILANSIENETLFSTPKQTQMQINYRVVFENKKPVLKAEILPVRFNDTLNVFEKATSITISLDYGKAEVKELKSSSASGTQRSVLADGKWVKVSIVQSGVFKIPYSKLSSWGFSNPANVKLFGYGGKMLPRKNSENTVDDLAENAVWHYGNAIYFYAQGIEEWSYNTSKAMFTHKLHDFTDKTYYFLTEGDNGAKVQAALTPESLSNYETSEFDDYAYYEEERYNLLSSGSRWLGVRLGQSYGSTANFEFNFPNTVTSKNGRISTECVARSGSTSDVKVYMNGNPSPLQTIYLSSVEMSATVGAAAREARATSNFTPVGDKTQVALQYSYSSTATAYIDKINVQVRRQLIATTPQMSFRDRLSIGATNITKFNLELANESMLVWDVTNPLSPKAISLQGSGKTKWFNYVTNELKEFVVFDPSGNISTPDFVENVDNQNLHGLPQVDYLIVTVPDFLTYASDLATLHETRNGLTTAVVTQNQIFNEFSSGNPDVTAIRSFLRMFYNRAENNTSSMPKYLLLFGDGTFDNRNAMKNNKILTFQSDNSLDYTGTYVSDDYFGLLDAAEGNNILIESIDIGIGRLPASDKKEAAYLVAKSKSYVNNQLAGNWRNRITFVADDGDSNIHMNDANKLAQKVALNHPEFNLEKIYFDAYPLLVTSSGPRYPDVNTLVEKGFSNGSVIFNYTGHGGWNALSAEKIITTETIQKQTNFDRLPLWVTATCEFGGYDHERTSAGELVLLNPKGGGIALLTTTRVVFSNQNYDINNQFFNYALTKDAHGMPLRFGDISKLTKRSTPSSVNKLNFSLLGDPGLRLGAPSLGVTVSSINHKSVKAQIDTLKALSVCTIEGFVNGMDGKIRSDFNGYATITVYDKINDVTALGNTGGTKFEYSSYENVLFSGKVKVENGEFTSVFKLPKDIRYDYGYGRISVYATNDSVHATGYFDEVVIGGISESIPDEQGPQITLWLNSTTFANGGKVGTTPLLIANVFDDNGINTSNTAIGHDIVLTIDEGNSGRYILNNYLEAKLDSYQEGTIQYQLPELIPGKHTLTLKVWDTYNNSSSATIEFMVESSSKLHVNKLNLYPVPVKTGLSMKLSIEHDDPNSAINATCQLVRFDGVIVRNQQQILNSSGTFTNEIDIKAMYDNGIPLKSGIYLLQVDLVSETGKKSRLSQKIIVTE